MSDTQRMSEGRYTRKQVEAVADRDKWKGGLTAHAMAKEALTLMDERDAAEAENATLREKNARLVEAVRDEGTHPAYHREVMARHRKEWPTLWRTIDGIVRAAIKDTTAPEPCRAPEVCTGDCSDCPTKPEGVDES